MLLDFDNIKEKDDFLNNGREIWHPWFNSLTEWSKECNFNEWVASLIIQGVPQHAWCEEALKIIAKTWGIVVIQMSVIPTLLIWPSGGLEFLQTTLVSSAHQLQSRWMESHIGSISWKIFLNPLNLVRFLHPMISIKGCHGGKKIASEKMKA